MESNTFIISNDQTSLSERNSKRTYQEIEQLYHFITYYAESVKHRCCASTRNYSVPVWENYSAGGYTKGRQRFTFISDTSTYLGKLIFVIGFIEAN